jgi:hypothetical protein
MLQTKLIQWLSLTKIKKDNKDFGSNVHVQTATRYAFSLHLESSTIIHIQL